MGLKMRWLERKAVTGINVHLEPGLPEQPELNWFWNIDQINLQEVPCDSNKREPFRVDFMG